jgi:trehalose-phosphatase
MADAARPLHTAVAAFAARPRVVVAADFDGTLAPFVTDPMKARALPGAIEALKAAAALEAVTVALVSGRDLATLAALTGLGPDDDVVLIGSHGAQASLQGPADLHSALEKDLLDEDAAARLSLVHDELEAVRSRYPAARLELKPSAVALHTRGVEPSVAAAAASEARAVGERHPGVHVMPGKDVVELTVVEANKGSALVALARSTESDATLYLGDDVTDERAFEALDPASGNVTVKVGEGPTAAAFRVPDPTSVVGLLGLFVELRHAQGHQPEGTGTNPTSGPPALLEDT